MSFAFFPAPLSPLFLGNSGQDAQDGCFGGMVLTTDSQTYHQCGNTIAYVYATQVSGTVPLYMGASADDGCFGGGGYTVNPQYGVCGGVVAYVYATQVAGTVPLFIGVDPNSPDGCFGGGVFTTDSQTYAQCGNTIAYVYPSIPAPTLFTLFPKFLIGSVFYLPPGAGVGSTISYAAGTMTGSTLSTTDSWNFEASAGFQFGNKTDNINITFGNSFGGSTTHTVDMQETTTLTQPFRAPSSDLINHDFDQIQIFLGVNVNGSQDYLGKITWGMDFSQILSRGFAPDGYNIPVGCLRPNSSIFSSSACVSVMNQLSSLGITSDDYPKILGADPFADPAASQTPDPDRYVRINAFQYFPDPGGQPVVWNVSNNSSTTNAHTTSYSYSVSVSLSGDLPLVSLKESNKFTFTHSSTTTNKTGSNTSSTLTLSSPSDTYLGPGTLNVYLDTIYKSFMFSFQ
jgi:hypothetical protein